VINTNLPPILQRFRDTAFDRSKIAIFVAFKPPGWDYLRKIFCGCQQMGKLPNGIETLPKSHSLKTQCIVRCIF